MLSPFCYEGDLAGRCCSWTWQEKGDGRVGIHHWALGFPCSPGSCTGQGSASDKHGRSWTGHSSKSWGRTGDKAVSPLGGDLVGSQTQGLAF